jgi:asparagine synthase (glutamine-hydrolysing)
MHAVARFAREHVTVVIGGEGADELFAGYPRYRWLERSATIDAHVPRPVRTLMARALAHGGARGGRLADVVRPARLAERNLDWVTSDRRAWRARLFGPRLHEAAVGELARLPTGAALDDGPEPASRLMRFDQTQWLPDDVLAKADRAGMLASLEIRTPFLERRLVEFAAAVPARVHFEDGGKSLLRGVLRRVLPEAAATGKTAFRVPADAWLRGPLRPQLEAQLTGSRLYDDGWFDRAAVTAVVDEHLAGRADRAAILWPIFTIGSWLDGWVSSHGG